MSIPKGDPIAWLSARLQPGQCVLDVGANKGTCSKAYAEAVGASGRVVAIEPDPRCWGHLDELADDYPQVKVRRCAIAEDAQDRTLYLARNHAQNSLIFRNVNTEADTGPMVIESLPLDDITTRTVHAVKIDVQGAELRVLAGASRILRECPLWVLEIWPWGFVHAGTTAAGVYGFMSHLGFTCVALDDSPVDLPRILAYEQDAPDSRFCNLAFVR